MKENLIEEILELKEKKNAVILAHNYQIPEVQDIADFVGDSLGLSKQAAATDAEMIVFCGVHFMAETAAIISPDKKVIIPDLEAGCSLADSINAEELRKWKSEHPGAVVVSYVNTTAEVKALTDYCCTSSNAVQVINAIPKDKEILFLPDKYLGAYVTQMTGRKIHIWDGACHVHEKIGDVSFDESKKLHPDAEFLVHPECGCSSSCMLKSLDKCSDNVHIFSTEGMINYVNESPAKEFVIATEIGILHRMKKANPDKKFFPLSENSVCEYMKKIDLEKLRDALYYEQYQVKVDAALVEEAKRPIDKMLEII